jgi:hypothetical protein
VISEILHSIENLPLCAELGHAKVNRDIQRKISIWAIEEQLTGRALETAFRQMKRQLKYLTWDKDRRTRLRQAIAVIRKVVRNWGIVPPVDQRAFVADEIPASTVASKIEEHLKKLAKGMPATASA